MGKPEDDTLIDARAFEAPAQDAGMADGRTIYQIRHRRDAQPDDAPDEGWSGWFDCASEEEYEATHHCIAEGHPYEMRRVALMAVDHAA